jgi:hypothetical protein
MFKVLVKCPHSDCGKSLIDENILVSNTPSIHLIVKKGNQEGDIYMSSIYGDYNCIEPDIPEFTMGDTLDFICPHCHRSLPKLDNCSCGGQTLTLSLANGGLLKFCNRKDAIITTFNLKKPKIFILFLIIVNSD